MMNCFNFIHRPLKAAGIYSYKPGLVYSLGATGLGAKMLAANPNADGVVANYCVWNANKWRLLWPGVYEVFVIGAGGGGGSAQPTASPNVFRRGWGGSAATPSASQSVLRAGTTELRIGIGRTRNPDASDWGDPGADGGTSFAAGVSSVGGAGGAGGSWSAQPSYEEQEGRLGSFVPVLGTRYGGGGKGGPTGSDPDPFTNMNEYVLGAPGEDGFFYIQLVG